MKIQPAIRLKQRRFALTFTKEFPWVKVIKPAYYVDGVGVSRDFYLGVETAYKYVTLSSESLSEISIKLSGWVHSNVSYHDGCKYTINKIKETMS